MIQIQEGKFYRTRTGLKLGPTEKNIAEHKSTKYPWRIRTGENVLTFTNSGRYTVEMEQDIDLVAEWTDETAEHTVYQNRPAEPTPEPRPTRAEVLDKADYAVADRGKRHGEPEENFGRIARLWEQHVLGRHGIQIVFDAHDVAMMMVCMKLARLQSNPSHLDSWVDVAGYAACGGSLPKAD